MIEFDGIAPALGKALNRRGYSELTAVQKAVLAPELTGADALVSAQTGSGKTVAFGLSLAPTLLGGAERFTAPGAPLALVITPTRELALQVKGELEWLYEQTNAYIASCVGGMDMRSERRALDRGAHIVVGTPGRLRDHIERNSLDTSQLKAVVLDEADEMLDLGFREDLEFILQKTPSERQTLLFSATVPNAIASLAKKYQRDAARIIASREQKQHNDIEYRALLVAQQDRENAIVNVLRYFEAQNALVFCSTRATVNHLTARFNNRGFSVVALSGELSQKERTHALQAMRDGRARVCIATDVAARGIDLPNLELVIHADLPRNQETLLHRSGRTGRAGRKGVSILIVPHSARNRTDRMLKGAGISANWAKPPSADDVLRQDNQRILADASLSEPLREEERALVQELLDRHGAEQVAAAFLRHHRAGQSAPEELIDIAPPHQAQGPKKHGRGFGASVWFSISVGRKQNAEPRWLLPMLCRAGNIEKNDIGTIQLENNQTYVEIEAESAERFLEAIGPSLTMEKTVKVKRLETPPTLSPDIQQRRFEKKPSASEDRSAARTKDRKKRPFNKAKSATSAPAPSEFSKTQKREKKPGKSKLAREARRAAERASG